MPCYKLKAELRRPSAEVEAKLVAREAEREARDAVWQQQHAAAARRKTGRGMCYLCVLPILFMGLLALSAGWVGPGWFPADVPTWLVVICAVVAVGGYCIAAVAILLDSNSIAEAEDMCIDPASAATITRVLAYSARTFPLDCDVYLERFSLCYSC
jgi:hypothetical protein